MSRITALPYLLAAPERVACDPWRCESRAGWIDLPPARPEWDFATPVNLDRTLRIDLPGVHADCKLAREDELAITVVWHASGTNLRGAIRPALARGDGSLRVQVQLAGRELGGTLHLETQLILLRASGARDPLAASRPGSVLWRQRESVHLEGEAARFPVEAIDFAQTGFGPVEAAWQLQWQREALDHATLGSVCLYVNSSHQTMRRVMTDPGSDAEARAVMSALEFDLVRQLVSGALDNPEFDDGVDFPDGSLGASLVALLGWCFPGDSLASLRGLRDVAPARLESRMQQAVRLFRER